MNARNVRIGAISDTHVSSLDPDSLSLFPRWIETLSPKQRERQYRLMARETHAAFESCLAHLEATPPDIIIHHGDITGGYREQGIHHEEMRGIARNCRERLERIAPTFFCIGNHDVGETGAATLAETMDACEEIAGPLFWKQKCGDLMTLGICAPLATYDGREDSLVRRQHEQREFVRAALRDHRSLPWTLHTHDLQPVQALAGDVAPYLQECERIIYGHLHNPLAGQLIQVRQRLAAAFSRNTMTKRLPEIAELCPATAPLWGRGYRMLDARWDGAELHTRIVGLDTSPDSERNPAASFWRSAFARCRPDTKGLPKPA